MSIINYQEEIELSRLKDLQKSTCRWLTKQEFTRIKELQDKKFINSGSPQDKTK